MFSVRNFREIFPKKISNFPKLELPSPRKFSSSPDSLQSDSRKSFVFLPKQTSLELTPFRIWGTAAFGRFFFSYKFGQVQSNILIAGWLTEEFCFDSVPIKMNLMSQFDIKHFKTMSVFRIYITHNKVFFEKKKLSFYFSVPLTHFFNSVDVFFFFFCNFRALSLNLDTFLRALSWPYLEHFTLPFCDFLLKRKGDGPSLYTDIYTSSQRVHTVPMKGFNILANVCT